MMNARIHKSNDYRHRDSFAIIFGNFDLRKDLFLPHFLVNSDFFLPQKMCKINLSDFLREFKKYVNLIIVLFICGFKLSQ